MFRYLEEQTYLRITVNSKPSSMTQKTFIRVVTGLVTLWVLTVDVIAQQSQESEDRVRQEKIELILRIKDRRTVHDGKLLKLLSDEDPAVRREATLAFGSIQDTTVLGLLTNSLTDKDPSVQLAGAFAIGQTGVLLGKQGKQQLEYDLIWKRLSQTSGADRLIEEIGKFGTETGLNDLMVRVGNAFPRQHTEAMTMCIARFGIRGVTSVDAVRYLIQFTKPADTTPWQVAYALQRIGSHEEIRLELDHLVGLQKHPDPLVRMYLATLLGKYTKEKGTREVLVRLAEFDGDWRVRVNALKSLSSFDLKGRDQDIWTFRRAFYSDNLYVRLTALASFANTGLGMNDTNRMTRDVFEELKHIARNERNDFAWQEQAEAAQTLAKLGKREALPFLQSKKGPYRYLHGRMLVALGNTGSPEALPLLSPYVNDDDPVLARSALEGLQTLSEQNPGDSTIIQTTYTASLEALGSDDAAVTTTAASILGDSLFRRASSVPPLLETLSSLRFPDDIETMQEVISTLGKLKDGRAILPLIEFLKKPDQSVVRAATNALRDLTGNDYSPKFPQSFEPLFTDFDFHYLRALPDTVRVRIETVRGDVVAELYPRIAPFTVMSFLKLAEQRGFYRGLSFHRVVPNFVVQGGDPRGDGWGGPGYSIRSEFSPLTYDTGVLGIASSGKDTEGSQFFITQSPQPHLDGRYTIFGRVISGLDVVNRIQVDDHLFDVSIQGSPPEPGK